MEPRQAPARQGRGAADRQKACTACAKSKVKCLWPETQDGRHVKCSRCLKLNAVCEVPVPGPRRTRGKATRARTIEEKVDGILSLLTAGQQADSSNTPHSTSSPPTRAAGTHPPELAPSSTQGPSIACAGDKSFNLHPSIPQNQPCLIHQGTVEITPFYRVSLAQADIIVGEYISSLVPNFPFVPFPSDTTALTLLRTTPVLLKAILMAARPSSHCARVSTERWLRETVAQEIVILGGNHIELAQAILIFLAWQGIHFFFEGRDASLLQLAIGIVGNLGLHKAVDDQGGASRSMLGDAYSLNFPKHQNSKHSPIERSEHSIEERRAVLGVYYLSSFLSSIMKKTSNLPFSSYFDRCCNEIIAAGEFATDTLLVEMVRTEMLASRARKVFSLELDVADAPGQPPILQPALSMAIHSMLHEVDEFEKTLSLRSVTHPIVQGHLHTIRIRLTEAALQLLAHPSTSRTQLLCTCLDSTRALFSNFLLVPAAQLTCLPISFFAYFAWGNITLIRLLIHENDPDWDAATARKVVNYRDLNERIVKHLEDGDDQAGEMRRVNESGQGTMRASVEKLRFLKDWFVAKGLEEENHLMGADEVLTPLSQGAGPDFGLGDNSFLEFWPWFSMP